MKESVFEAPKKSMKERAPKKMHEWTILDVVEIQERNKVLRDVMKELQLLENSILEEIKNWTDNTSQRREALRKMEKEAKLKLPIIARKIEMDEMIVRTKIQERDYPYILNEIEKTLQESMEEHEQNTHRISLAWKHMAEQVDKKSA